MSEEKGVVGQTVVETLLESLTDSRKSLKMAFSAAGNIAAFNAQRIATLMFIAGAYGLAQVIVSGGEHAAHYNAYATTCGA